MEPYSFRVIWEKGPKPSWLWNLWSILEEGRPCRQLKFLSCPTKTQLPKIVLKCRRNSIRQSRLFPSGMCKRKTKKNLWQKDAQKERMEGREGGRQGGRAWERGFISSQKNCKGNTRPHLSTWYIQRILGKEVIGPGSLDVNKARYLAS